MYRFTLLLCTFVLCAISCVLSAPATSLLSALLSPSPSSAASHSAASARQKPETGLTTYDQKQSGKYNIHLNIKDVAIIALDAGHIDGDVGDSGEDYYYDIDDFTVKPIFGLVDNIPSSTEKTSSTTVATPPLIHSESEETDDDEAMDNPSTESASIIEEPIIKDPINKTQSVTILSENTAPANNEASSIVVTTPTPSPEDLPPKLSLADIANVQSAQKPFPTKPNEIPVHIILEQPLQHKKSSHPNLNTLLNGNLRNRVRATTSASRRITAPHDVQTAFGNDKHRKHYVQANRRNCVLNQYGQCQNSNRRSGTAY
ncbi:uncharacterized protein LOC116341685 isoform X2 [Contarinia nasturtii]|uniref:uncharacterized protein LOC116341685 isoform X2 n=1 Tax=Contarinia nasturtii TaxID=265458 RepID=UPI0012D484F7|nr:uncharacterized protein LOC116341685 isoform X2 [Contarinia nasturtii]